MRAEAKITGKRQLTIPKEIYELMGLNNADKIVFELNEKNEVVIRKKEVNTLSICPVCEKEVKNEENAVIKNTQKYHLACWKSFESIGSGDFPIKYTLGGLNKITREQMQTMTKVVYMAAAYKADMSRTLRDNEVIVMTPTKITFMEEKLNIIGKASEFKSDEIFKCNFDESDSNDDCEIENDFDDVIATKLTKTQKKSISRILSKIKHIKEDMMKNVLKNEVIIMVPTKVVFMENKPGIVGMVENYSSKNIFMCNSEETFVSELLTITDIEV